MPTSSIPGYDHLRMLEALLPCLLRWIVTSLTFVFPSRHFPSENSNPSAFGKFCACCFDSPLFSVHFSDNSDIQLHKLHSEPLLYFVYVVYVVVLGWRTEGNASFSFIILSYFLMSLNQELVEVGWQPASLNNLVVLFVLCTPSAKLQMCIDTPYISAGVQALYPLNHLSCPEAYSHKDISLSLLSCLPV